VNIKRIGIAFMAFVLCVLSAGCEKDKGPTPDQLQTPQYSVSEPAELPPPAGDEIHTSDEGVIMIAPQETSTANAAAGTEAGTAPASVPGAARSLSPAIAAVPVTPENVWENDSVVTYNAFTLPEKAAFDDGSIGVLSIGKIGLTVNVYETADQMEDMEKGVAHFKSTSAWDGNCALSGHNSTASGYGAYFKDLHLLAVGDSMTYKTALGEREYRVTAVKTISEEDWSGLSRSADNRLTLITCTFTDASKRLMVQAEQA
jgi:LPXTG-site transpeptidase (sortase) family protein